MNDDEIIRLNFEGWPLPKEYLEELGRIAALWATLESFMGLCIGKLAGFDKLTDPTAFILLAHTNFPQRLDMLGSLCENLIPEYPKLKGYKDVVGKLRAAQTLRNRFLHNGLSLDEASGEVGIALGSARGTLKVGVHKITLADVRRCTIAVHEAQLALYKLVLGRDISPIWTRRSSGVGP